MSSLSASGWFPQVNSAVAMMEKDLKEVIDDKDDRLRELEEDMGACQQRNRQLDELLALERTKSLSLQARISELESEQRTALSSREEIARNERNAAMRQAEELQGKAGAAERRVEELERAKASKAVEDSAVHQRLYTLEATVNLQHKEVEMCKEREERMRKRLAEVEEQLREAEVSPGPCALCYAYHCSLFSAKYLSLPCLPLCPPLYWAMQR